MDSYLRDGILELADKTIQLTNGSAGAYGARGSLYARLGQHDKARADYEKYIEVLTESVEKQPENPAVWKQRAEAFRRRGRLKEAVEDVTKAIELDGTDSMAFTNRAWCYANLGNFDKALADADSAIRLNRNNFHALEHRASIQFSLGNYEKSIADAKRALEINSTNIWPHRWLGRASIALKRYNELLEYYDTADHIGPNTAVSWENRARAHAGLEQWEQAAAAYSEAITLAPDKSQSWILRGKAYEQLGRHEEAQANFDKYIDFLSKPVNENPDDWRALSTRARAYGNLGRWDAAIDDYRAVIALNSEANRDHNNLAWLLATCPDERVRDAEQAVAHAEKAVSLVSGQGTSREGNYQNTLGVAHYRAGDWKPAIEALEKSETLLKGKSLGFNAFFLAMAHWQLGHKVEARDWYDKSVQWMEKNKPDNEELRHFREEAEELLVINIPAVAPVPEEYNSPERGGSQ